MLDNRFPLDRQTLTYLPMLLDKEKEGRNLPNHRFTVSKKVPVCEVSSRPYLFAYCLFTYKTMYCAQFRPLNLNAALRQGRNRKNALFDRYINNRRTGKGATKLRTLELLGNSEIPSDRYI